MCLGCRGWYVENLVVGRLGMAFIVELWHSIGYQSEFLEIWSILAFDASIKVLVQIQYKNKITYLTPPPSHIFHEIKPTTNPVTSICCIITTWPISRFLYNSDPVSYLFHIDLVSHSQLAGIERDSS
jgi:hypothetical protein